MYEKLLKELNKFYPDAIPIRKLKNKYSEIVLKDIQEDGLVKNKRIPWLDENGEQIKNRHEGALSINSKGIEFLKKIGNERSKSDSVVNASIGGSENIASIGQSGGKISVNKEKSAKNNNFDFQIGTTAILVATYFALPAILPEELNGFTFTIPRIASYSLGVIWFISIIMLQFSKDTLFSSNRMLKLYKRYYTICNLITMAWFSFILIAYLTYLLI